jgi:hypothetical protein
MDNSSVEQGVICVLDLSLSVYSTMMPCCYPVKRRLYGTLQLGGYIGSDSLEEPKK